MKSPKPGKLPFKRIKVPPITKMYDFSIEFTENHFTVVTVYKEREIPKNK